MPGAFLLLIVLFGVCLRFYGLDWGTDLDGRFHPLHPDETTLINAASQLRESLKPSVTAYGTLPMYLLYVVGKPAAVFGGRALFEPDHQAFTHAIARTLSASFSVLAIWFAFKIGTRTDDDRVGLLAAAFLAVMVLPIQLAHFYTVDGIFAALAALALYRSIKAEQGRDCWRDHILIGIFTGLAASVRLGGILLLAPLVAIRLRHLLSGGGRLGSGEGWRQRALRTFGPPSVALGAALAILVSLQPYMVLEPADYWRAKGGGDLMTSVGIARGEIARTWTLYDAAQPRFFFHVTNLLFYGVGLPLQVLGLLGLVFFLIRSGIGHIQIFTWCVIYFLSIGGLQAKNIRYLAPLLPFLALGGARMCLIIYRRTRGRQRVATSLVTALTLVASASYAFAFTRIYGTLDSRLEASREITRHLPNGSTIGVEHTGISMKSLLPEGYRAQPIMTGSLFNLDRYLLAQEKIELLLGWLDAADGLALVDAGRGNHFLAAPRSYPIEHQFYSRVYAGELGFEKIASYRHFPSAFGFDFEDSAAEISFYAFDHPRVTLFVRSSSDHELARLGDEWMSAVRVDNDWTDRHLVEGIDGAQANRLEDAKSSFRAALRIRPDYTLAHLLLSGLYERLELEELSSQSWDAALETTSFNLLKDGMFVNDLEGFYLASEHLLLMGARKTGRRCLQIAESLGGTNLRRKIGDAYLRHQMPKEAISVFEDLSLEQPEVAAHYADLCRAHLANDDRDRARMVLGFYVELETDAKKIDELRKLVESTGLPM